MVICLVAYGKLLFSDFESQFSIYLLSCRGLGWHRVVLEYLTHVME